MKQLPTLYTIDSKNKLREWTIHIDTNSYWSVAGLTDGKKIENKPTFCKGKNIGRSNETTPEEQAFSEATSKWDKQKKTAYYESMEEAEAGNDFYQVMLASKWKDRIKKVNFPMLYQPKLDGIRCLMTKTSSVSRSNTPINVIPHIEESLKKMFDNVENLKVDGELYNHALRDDFQKLISIVRKDKPTDENLAMSKKHMQYWIYDIPTIGDLDESVAWAYRMAAFEVECVKYNIPMDHIVIVHTESVSDLKDADRLHEKYLALGYEGSMYRTGDTTYKNSRSRDLLKRKEFFDEEVEVTRIEEGKGNWAGYAKQFFCKTSDGVEFKSNIRGSQEYLKGVLEERDFYIGKSATLRYFRKTDDNVPYLPVIINLAREEFEG